MKRRLDGLEGKLETIESLLQQLVSAQGTAQPKPQVRQANVLTASRRVGGTQPEEPDLQGKDANDSRSREPKTDEGGEGIQPEGNDTIPTNDSINPRQNYRTEQYDINSVGNAAYNQDNTYDNGESDNRYANTYNDQENDNRYDNGENDGNGDGEFNDGYRRDGDNGDGDNGDGDNGDGDGDGDGNQVRWSLVLSLFEQTKLRRTILGQYDGDY